MVDRGVGERVGGSACRRIGVLEWMRGGLVMAEWWSGGVVEWWSGGVVEWWSGGVVEWWASTTSSVPPSMVYLRCFPF